MDEPITDQEAFEHYLQNFIEWLGIITLSPVELCNAWGNYNVARELVSDLKKDGNSIVTMPCSYLTEHQKQAVVQFLTSLNDIPESVLVGATSVSDNQQAMNHSCWVKYREYAPILLMVLASSSKRNKKYFNEPKP